jgi:tetratricopeptide (TPR) repeat protein
MQGDTEQAEAALDYALRLHPDNIDALIFKSRSRLINGHITEASHILDSIPDQSDREVMFLRAEVLMATHQHTKADTLLRTLIEEENYEANAYADIIDLLVDNGQNDMANLWIDEATQRHPDHQVLTESAAYSHTLQERFDEAITLYNRLLDIDPYSTFYWEELGKIYFRLEEYDKAIEAFEFVIAINGDECHYALYAVANCYFNIGNYEHAEEYYHTIHERYPETVDPLFHMGMCRVNRGDDEGALDYFTQALTTIPEGSEEQAQIYSQMSLIFSRKGQHAKAVTYTDEALKICPDNTELIIMKGHELLCQGKYEESTTLFLQALELNTESTERSLFLIAVSMLENGHCEMSHYMLHLLKDNPAIEPEILYPYLCFCEWTLRKENFRETLTEALAQCPQKTYEIFSLAPAQGESADRVIERLMQSNIEN